MPVQHIMLLDLDDAGARLPEDLFPKVRELLSQVPGVLDVSIGENFTSRAHNVTHAGIVTLASREALEGYATHPRHLEAQDLVRPHLRGAQAVDFES